MDEMESMHPAAASHDVQCCGSWPSAAANIEHEIDALRQTMIRTYLEESSLGAERVIEISRRLDIMINAYMRSKLSRPSG